MGKQIVASMYNKFLIALSKLSSWNFPSRLMHGFLLVSLVNAHDNNTVTTTKGSSKWTSDSNSEITTGSMSESTTGSTLELTAGLTINTTSGLTINTTSATTSMAGSTIDATSATTSMAGSTIDATSVTTSMAGTTARSQSEFTTLTQTKTTVMSTVQLSGNSSIKNNNKFKAALIINPIQKNTKRAGPGKKMKKKASHLLYQEYDQSGKIVTTFYMKNLDDVVTFFNVYYESEICNEVCEED